MGILDQNLPAPRLLRWVGSAARLPAAARFGMAAMMFAAAVLLRFCVLPAGAGSAFLTFYPTMILCFLLCGMGPGLCLSVACSLAALQFLLGSHWSARFSQIGGLATLGFLMSSVLTGIIVQRLRRGESRILQVSTDLLTMQRAEEIMAQAAEEARRARDDMAAELHRRETAEANLSASEERSRLLLQNVVTEALYLVDPDGIIETWSAGAERIKGFSAPEVIGRHFSMFFTPEDLALGEPARLMTAARDTGRYTGEAWRMRKDGTRFQAKISITAIFREDGSLRGFAKVTQDVTDRAIEEAQREIIIEAAPNGMMIVDEAGTITLANAQVGSLFGYPAGALIGQSVEILVPVGFRQAHGAMRSKFTGGQDVRAMDSELQIIGRKADGSAVPIEVLLRAVKTRSGRIVVASIFDVTERLRIAAARHEAEARERLAIEQSNQRLDKLSRHLAEARDRAEQASRAKSRFLAGMSHELRTPLNGILGYAQLLRMEGGMTPTQNARLDAMLGAGRHLLEMITCVLDLSEIEADHITLQAVAVDLTAIAVASIDLVRPAAEARGLSLHSVLAPGTPGSLVCDPTRLRQILLNLLGNAVKFTARGSVTLRVAPAADGTTLRIEVADTGPGIPAEKRQRLFGEFERLETAASDCVEGAGLGLALSARFAKLMGGRLFHADNAGGGSVFCLELPLHGKAASPAAKPASTGAAALAPAGPARRLNLLVVDDVAMNRDIAGSFLRFAGHAVSCVEGGEEAVEAAGEADFDLVLMDLRMPGIDGFEATRRIRALPGPRGRVPIIALTAHAFSEQIEECRRAGMAGHVAKPFTQSGLLAAVLAAMENGLAREPAEAAEIPAAAPSPSVMNLERFSASAAFLQPAQVTAYLEQIAACIAGALRRLRADQPAAQADDTFLDSVHQIAGTASMFGFDLLAHAARHFEHAARKQTPESAALAESLVRALETSLTAVQAQHQAVRPKAPFPAAGQIPAAFRDAPIRFNAVAPHPPGLHP